MTKKKAAGGKKKVTVAGAKTEKKKVVVAPKVDDITTKPVAELSVDEALSEIARMSTELDFDKAYTAEDGLETLQAAVAEGRKALAIDDSAAAGTTKNDAPEEDSVDIVSGSTPNQKYIRTYCLEVHGEDFLDLANQFVSKHPGMGIVPSSSIKGVKVRWEEKDAEEEGRVTPKSTIMKGTGYEVKADALAKANEVGGQVLVALERELGKK